jgi:PAS domain S-box-containing protein
MYLTPIYAALVTYVGVVGPRKLPFIIACMCAGTFILTVLLSETGVIPVIKAFRGFELPIQNAVAVIFANVGLLMVVAFISSYTADLLKKTKGQLRDRNVDLENKTRQLRQARDELAMAHDRLERRVEERTAELEQANIDLRREMTEHERTEEALRESEERYRLIFENISDAIWSIDPDLRVTSVSPSIERVSGYKPSEIEGKKLYEIEAVPPELWETAANDIQRVLNGERIDSSTYEFLTKDGRTIVADVSGAPLIREGKVVAILSVARDITERQQAEEKIRASLKEKEVLLQEIHHRVKNNLQIISSLLNLQSGYSKDRETMEMFTDSQNRIRSMALVHEQLYQSKDLSRIDFTEYLKHLVHQLFRSYGADTRLIEFNLTAEQAFFDLERAIPCGLIINELVSNSLKHAFPGNREGKLNIDLHKDDGGHTLTVSDNGVGMPDKVDFRNTKTLGLQVVNTLVDQLDGTIELVDNGGTIFRISFPG